MGVTGEENVCVGQLLITITSSPASGSSDFAPSPPLSVASTTLDAAAAEECDPLPPTVSVPVPPEAPETPEAPVPVISAPMTPAPMTPSPFLSPSFDSHTSLFSSMPPASPSESTSRPPSMPAPAAPVAPDCETPPPAMSAPLRPAFPAVCLHSSSSPSYPPSLRRTWRTTRCPTSRERRRSRFRPPFRRPSLPRSLRSRHSLRLPNRR